MNRILPLVAIVLIVLSGCATNSINLTEDALRNNIRAAALSVVGPYEIRSFLTPQAAEFSGATIYYPIDAKFRLVEQQFLLAIPIAKEI